MAVFTVTTNLDEAFDGTETTLTPDGAGLSLREAIGLAGDGDLIVFDETVFTGGLASVIRLVDTLEIDVEFVIDGTTGTDIVITGDVADDD